jgi:hypothetical protein
MDCNGKIVPRFIEGGMRKEVYRIKGIPEGAMVWDGIPELPRRDYGAGRGGGQG